MLIDESEPRSGCTRSIARSLVLLSIMLLAVCVAARAERFTYRHYGSENGLNNQAINCLLQDRTGYIWVGTDNGLFRYDGTRFREFGLSSGLPNTEIVGLAESPQGELWVSTMDGVARRVGAGAFKAAPGIQGQVQGVAFDFVGRIYLTLDSGLLRGVPGSNGTYQFSQIISGHVTGLYSKGTEVWVAKDETIWRLDGNALAPFGSVSGLPPDHWQAMAQDSTGNFWVRSAERLYELPKGSARFVDRSAGIPLLTIGAIRLYADSHGRLFVASDLGMVTVDGQSHTLVSSRNGLPADAVGPILLDRDESLWVGTASGLVRRLGHGEWVAWKKQDGLSHSIIWAIRGDRTGNVWVGNSGGLDILNRDGEVVRSWGRHNGLTGDRVLSMADGPSGDVFVGTDPAWISRFNRDGDLICSYRAESGLMRDRIYKLAFDRRSRLWVGSRAGIFRSRNPVTSSRQITFERLQVPKLPIDVNVYDIYVDDSDVVWLATALGLVRFDDEHWRVFTTADGLRNDKVSVVIEGQSAVWITYRDTVGITRLAFHGDQVQATHINRDAGLASDRIYTLKFDEQGRLWAASDNGVDVLDKGRWRHYGIEDGLISQDTDALAMYLDYSNNMWIGTSDGLSRYSPPRYPLPMTPPTVVITSIHGISQSFQIEDQPRLPYRRSALTFQFSSLDFSYEGRERFRYRLAGFADSNWVETREKVVQFAGLPAGRYVFEVTAANPEGDWNPVSAEFSFSIQPPWWQSWWFLILLPLILLLLARLLWKLRVHALVAQKVLLEEEVAERTAQLAESRRQLVSAMDAAKLGIWSEVLTREQPVNVQLQTILDPQSSGEIDFERLREIIVPSDRERFQRLLTERSAPYEKEEPTFECRTFLPNGRECWLELRGGIVDGGWETNARASGIIMDVTEQKNAEQEVHALEHQLLQAQKMEAIGRLAGGIAHDFNNLLMIIQNYAEMLQESIPADDRVRSNIEQIVKASERGAGLTAQLLAFSRKQVLAPVVLNLNRVVDEAARMLSRLIGENIDLQVSYEEMLWAVKADPNQIVQVLINLCVNARDAMADGGTLRIETRNLIASEQFAAAHPGMSPGEYVSLSVRDTGSGMSKEVQEQIFEPFFTTKERGKGTGLGLPTVFGIVKQSGGHVWVESELGTGTCFTIVLPRVQAATELEGGDQLDVSTRQDGTILLAEDEDPLRETVSRYLRNLGYTLIEAGSGPQALVEANRYQGQIDLLITDVVMPKMDGGELSRRLRALQPGIRTIFMSGYTDDETVRFSIRDEGGMFLQKPFRLSALALKVREALSSK